jgi:hypothetical protein
MNDWPTSLADAREQMIELRAEVERLQAELRNSRIATEEGARWRRQGEAELRTKIERQSLEWIELMNWLNTHYPHVAIAFARRAKATADGI